MMFLTSSLSAGEEDDPRDCWGEGPGQRCHCCKSNLIVWYIMEVAKIKASFFNSCAIKAFHPPPRA